MYGKVIGSGFVAGALIACLALNVWYLSFSLEYSLKSFWTAVRWSLLIAGITAVFVTIGTIRWARRLTTRRGKALFVAFSFVSPILGWLLVGIVSGFLATWDFFFGYPVIGVVSGVFATVIAGVASFFLPSSEPVQRDSESGAATDL